MSNPCFFLSFFTSCLLRHHVSARRFRLFHLLPVTAVQANPEDQFLFTVVFIIDPIADNIDVPAFILIQFNFLTAIQPHAVQLIC